MNADRETIVIRHVIANVYYINDDFSLVGDRGAWFINDNQNDKTSINYKTMGKAIEAFMADQIEWA